jgi:hypothetical protein
VLQRRHHRHLQLSGMRRGRLLVRGRRGQGSAALRPRAAHHQRVAEPQLDRALHNRKAHSEVKKCAIRDESGFRVADRSRRRFATPADFPLHDGTPYRGLRVRRWGLGFLHRSRSTLCRAVPNPKRYDSQLVHRCIPREPTRSTLNIIWSCRLFEHKGVSTSRVSPPGPLSISYGHVG